MASIGAWFQVLIQDIRAWRRGQKRVVPRFGSDGQPSRGRIYSPTSPESSIMKAKSEPVGTLTAKHYGPDGELKGTHTVRAYRPGGE